MTQQLVVFYGSIFTNLQNLTNFVYLNCENSGNSILQIHTTCYIFFFKEYPCPLAYIVYFCSQIAIFLYDLELFNTQTSEDY